MAGERQLAAFEDREGTARLQHRGFGEDYKLRHGIPLNIWDAARSYRSTQGLEDTSLRAILKDERFRNAWRDFRGGGIKGNKPTSTKTKFKAAEVLGWYESEPAAIERLRNLSP